MVNQIIRRSDNPVPQSAVAKLSDVCEVAHDQPPPYQALFAKGQLRWIVVGVITGTCAASAALMTAGLLPGAAVSVFSAMGIYWSG